MSYCRWSCLNGMCDVYVYESQTGFETHVGRKRLTVEPPEAPLSLLLDGKEGEYIEARRKRQLWLDEHGSWEPIGLAHDGESFTDATAQDCADRLKDLRDLGYNVPDYAIEELEAEAAEVEAGG